MDLWDRFPKEVLKAQDGKRVVVTVEDGGRVIGEGTFKYQEDTGDLSVDIRPNNLEMGSFLMDEWARHKIGE